MDVPAALSPRIPVAAALAVSVLAVWLAPRLDKWGHALTARLPRRLVPLDRNSPLWRNAAVLVLAAALVHMTFVAPDYGYNIDEAWQSQHGRDLYAWYARALSGAGGGPFHSGTPVMDNYGGFFELPAEILVRLLPFDATLTRHLATAWFGVAGLAAAFALGSLLHSRAAGLLALLFLLATPRYIGQAFSNPKDVPFAACMLLALTGICWLLPRLPRPPPGRVLFAGFAIGAAMGVRIGGVLALAIFALGLAAWECARAGCEGRAAAARDLPWVLVVGVGVLLLAWGVMLLAWPWAQAHPLTRPFQAIAYFRNIVGVQHVDFPVFFEGRFYRLSQVPRTYTLVWLAISLPEFVLAAPLAAPALRAAWRRRWRWPDARHLGLLLTFACVALALATTADPGVIQYDGMRHFLFVLPPLMVLLAVGVAAGLTRLPPRGRAGGLALVASLWGLTLWDAGRLHPYEYTYFNRTLAGGLARAAGAYETDYLGLSYREAVRWVVSHVIPPRTRPLRVTICKGWEASLADALAAAGASPRHYRRVAWNKPADVAVAITRADCNRRFAGRTLATIGPAGTPLAYVIQLYH